MEILGRTPIGSLVYFSGHIMFFLGVKDGKGFVLSAIGSFVLPGMPESEVQTVNCVCVNALDMLRRNGTTWLENLKTVVDFGIE